MTRIGNNGSGKSDWYGSFGSILNGFFTGEVSVGLDVVAQTSPNMSVKVNFGTAVIPTGTDPSKTAFLVRHDTSAGETVTITTANGSNPRRDIIVAYYDVAVIDAVNPNNPTALKFAAVAGTPAASPADPSGATIQAAVGASNPYIILARVLVGTSVTQITTPNITDLRTMASSLLKPKAVTAPQIDFGGAGSGVWWEEIGRTTLVANGDTITVNPLPARKYLMILVNTYATGGTIGPFMVFNNDNGANYANRNSTNGAADLTQVSTNQIYVTGVGAAEDMYAVAYVTNLATKPKLAAVTIIGNGVSGAANAPNKRENYGKWHNTSNQITRVDVANSGTGDFAIGSEVIVLGHD